MFNGRSEHQAYIMIAAGFCITGAVLITIALFRMYLVRDACYGPIIMSVLGAAFFLAGIGVGAYIKRRMT